MLTTVQDCGRWGFQDRGVPVCGAMDTYSHKRANWLVGNDSGDATLEVTLMGPEIEFEEQTVVAVTGGDFALSLDGNPISANRSIVAPRGARLQFGNRIRGARSYLAVAGGIAVAPFLGSRSTHLASGTGGFEGRALKAGDCVPIGTVGEKGTGIFFDGPNRVFFDGPPREKYPRPFLPADGARLRVLPGPHLDRFAKGAFEKLVMARYRISPRSDRMGYRLEGVAIDLQTRQELISCPMPLGGIQITAAGQPILLLADHATTGGYPVAGVVITADLPIAGQLAPGDWVELEPCSIEVALAALREQERML
jgi:antagonist of KipI